MSEHGSVATSTHHVVSWRVYIVVFLALCVLTVITVETAGHDFGDLNLIVAVGIAIAKATLVVLYFMHARYSPKLTGLVIGASVAFFFILVFLLLTDYVSRPWPLVATG